MSHSTLIDGVATRGQVCTMRHSVFQIRVSPAILFHHRYFQILFRPKARIQSAVMHETCHHYSVTCLVPAEII